MNQPEEPKNKRNLSGNQLLAACIGAAGAIAASLVGLFLTSHSGTSAPASTLAPQASAAVSLPPHSATGTASPPSAASPSLTPKPTESSAPRKTQTRIPMLKPVESQNGWTLAWKGQLIIGPQGRSLVNVDPNSGPQVSNGEDCDIQYIPGLGGGTGWNGCDNSLGYWPTKYKPGPATIVAISGSLNSDASSNQARIGDHIYELIKRDSWETNVVAYMQVIAVGNEDATVNMWLWNAVQ
jgi:hypothetical protein